MKLLSVQAGVLVVERVVPGTPASSLPDDEATKAIAAALTNLWTPVPVGCTLPSVEEECAPLADVGATAPLPRMLIDAARSELDRLLGESGEPVVLHGDLHHDNLLWSIERGWVAIDPHGVTGDPGYDVGPLLLNPWGADLVGLLPRRLALLAELLAMPVDRLAGSGLVRAVLSEAWTVQDSGRPDGGPLRLAEAILHRP